MSVYQADDSGIQIKRENCISQSQVDFNSTWESLFLLFIIFLHTVPIYSIYVYIYMTLFVQL